MLMLFVVNNGDSVIMYTILESNDPNSKLIVSLRGILNTNRKT
jgi:hypothetical protein